MDAVVEGVFTFVRDLIRKSTSKRNPTLKIHRETSTSYSPSLEVLTLSDQLVDILCMTIFWLNDVDLWVLNSIGEQQLQGFAFGQDSERKQMSGGESRGWTWNSQISLVELQHLQWYESQPSEVSSMANAVSAYLLRASLVAGPYGSLVANRIAVYLLFIP